MTPTHFCKLFVCLLAILVAASPMPGQNVTGAILGTVTDSSERFVSGAASP